eukprot:TRINITY_DN15211_c0_g1_i1.p1 TRINITY_DN15211_c0_g1~~TRINITY_DN15211_c0_g1_i1.p1  ORF type:complete len:325 (+),score=43.00 TRINITY_DN15211_c0_g1_i1:43-1017(+)
MSNSSKRFIARVYFIDGSCKAFAIERTETVKSLIRMITEKIQLKFHHLFALFERTPNYERFLELHSKPADIAESWDKPQQSCFLFKKRLFLHSLHIEDKEMEDLVARDLVYKQAHFSVISSSLPCSADHCVKLAGLQMKVLYGSFNSSNHVSGFLTVNDSLKNFVPKHLMPLKKPYEWESLILKEYNLCEITSPEIAKLEYILNVMSFENYGLTLFPSCKPLQRTMPRKVIIGINSEGIKLIKPKTMVTLAKYQFLEICSWSSNQTMFGFDVGNTNSCTKLSFDTKQGAAIAATIQSYIDVIVQMLKNESEEESETLTFSSSDV